MSAYSTEPLPCQRWLCWIQLAGLWPRSPKQVPLLTPLPPLALFVSCPWHPKVTTGGAQLTAASTLAGQMTVYLVMKPSLLTRSVLYLVVCVWCIISLAATIYLASLAFQQGITTPGRNRMCRAISTPSGMCCITSFPYLVATVDETFLIYVHSQGISLWVTSPSCKATLTSAWLHPPLCMFLVAKVGEWDPWFSVDERWVFLVLVFQRIEPFVRAAGMWRKPLRILFWWLPLNSREYLFLHLIFPN